MNRRTFTRSIFGAIGAAFAGIGLPRIGSANVVATDWKAKYEELAAAVKARWEAEQDQRETELLAEQLLRQLEIEQAADDWADMKVC